MPFNDVLLSFRLPVISCLQPGSPPFLFPSKDLFLLRRNPLSPSQGRDDRPPFFPFFPYPHSLLSNSMAASCLQAGRAGGEQVFFSPLCRGRLRYDFHVRRRLRGPLSPLSCVVFLLFPVCDGMLRSVPFFFSRNMFDCGHLTPSTLDRAGLFPLLPLTPKRSRWASLSSSTSSCSQTFSFPLLAFSNLPVHFATPLPLSFVVSVSCLPGSKIGSTFPFFLPMLFGLCPSLLRRGRARLLEFLHISLFSSSTPFFSFFFFFLTRASRHEPATLVLAHLFLFLFFSRLVC